MKKFDAIIIGAGQAGMPLAKNISNMGLSVALIEERAIGGTCINDGCSPTKTMVASARVAHLVSRAKDYGVQVNAYQVDQASIKARKDHIVKLFREGAEKSLEKGENIHIIKGRAVFKSPHTLTIINSENKHTEVQAENIFINTGAEPHLPNIKGLDDIPYLTSTTIMELTQTPEHLIILGGGYVGLEFAQMFRRFGSKVTILDRAERLVPKEDKDVCKEISKIFKQEGIDTLFQVKAQSLTYQDNVVRLEYQDPSGKHHIDGSHILIATGRVPSSLGLGLENAGVKVTEKGHIAVNEHFESSTPGIYALGDVAGSPPFTHMAYHDAHLVFQHIYEGKKISKDSRLTPYCIFIDPQLARIGLNEQEAKEQDIPYKTGKFWMKHAGRALEVDEKAGFFKILVNPKSKKIIGATVLSIDGGEVMAIIQMAMVGGVTYDTIQHLPIAHPTLAESLNNLMGQID